MNSARQDHFELRCGVVDISQRVSTHSAQLNALNTEVFKLKEENSAQQEQIHELRSQLEAYRAAASSVQAEQADRILELTAEVRSSLEQIAKLSKAHSTASQQLESLTKQEAARGSPALRAAPPPASASASPYLRSVQPSGGPYEIQWANGAPPPTIPAPSPVITSVVTHAPGAILPPPPMHGGIWASSPQQIIFR